MKPPPTNHEFKLQDTFDLTEFAKLKIIVVPIAPQRKEDFDSYFTILKKFASVSLAQLTPPDSQAAKYIDQLYHQGNIHYEFCTAYNRDLNQLEEIELSRQILGVIGIMNCKQVGDLQTAYKQFQQIVQKYPTSLAHRCFAFEPGEDQPDNTKGLIMIPNAGDVSFYLQTMINDFTSDILLALGLYAGQIERKTSILGPIIVSPAFAESDGAEEISSQAKSPNNSIMSPSAVVSGTSAADLDSTAPSNMAALTNPEKTKKRTPARAQKLLGDIYLLGGRLDLAIGCFVTAIEGCKINNDYQWQASALEGYVCAQMVSHLTDLMPDAGDGPIMQLPSSREIMELAAESKRLFAFICELPERYREVVFLYDKSFSYGSYGYYPILQIQSSLRISNFLSFAFLAGFTGSFINCAGISWTNDSKSLTAEIATRIANTPNSLPNNPSTIMHQQSSSQIEKTVLQNGIGVTRLDIMTWITRISLTGNEFLFPKDYLMILSSICTLCCRIEAFRKHAFFLRLVGVASRNLEKQHNLIYPNSPTSHFLKNWSLVVMHKVCDLLENPECKEGLDDELWLEHYRSIFDPNSTSNADPPPYALSLRYGWPALRIGILKEAILLSDSNHDHANTIIFTAKLLRKLYRSLGRIDQQYYSELLLRVVLNHRKQLAAEPEKTPVIQFKDGMELGVLQLLKMEIVRSTSRYNITEHKKTTIDQPGTKSTFLYSPFAKKKTEQKEMLFAANEMIHVDVTFGNPLLIEFDVQIMVLCGQNLDFKPLAISTLIPPENRSHKVRLSCVPNAPGILDLTAVQMRMLGGCIEETAVPLQRHLKNTKKFTSSGILKKQSEQDRFGKSNLQFIDNSESKIVNDFHLPWCLPIKVIPAQPMMELLETSLGSHQAITLFEGERSALTFTVRNIGRVPINYIFMKIIDSIAVGEPDESQFETEVYQKSIRAFYPLSSVSFPENIASDIGAIAQMTYVGDLSPTKLEVELNPGEQVVIKLGVFGKRNCTGGQVHLSYGYLNSEDETFYTRELSIPFLLTVVQSLSFRNIDLLHYAESHKAGETPTAMAVTERSLSVEEIMMNPRLSTTLVSDHNSSNTFLLTFDFRNEWDEPFKVTFDIFDDPHSLKVTSTTTTLLHAGVTKRYLLSKAIIQQPIPTPPGKQFIVKSGPKYNEGLSRALFWYREELIGGLNNRGRIVMKWTCSNNRNGVLQFRSFEMVPRFIPILKSDSVVIDGIFSGNTVQRNSCGTFQCACDTVVDLAWKITNLLDAPIKCFFRAIPMQDNNSSGDLKFCSSDHVICIGSSNEIIDEILPDQTYDIHKKMLFSAIGNFKIIAHIERIKEKKPAVIKKKYEASEIVLDDIETITWFKGIRISVLER